MIMQTFAPMPCRTNRELLCLLSRRRGVKSLFFFLMTGTLLAGTMICSACGGATNNHSAQVPLSLSGNWQFTMAAPSDNSFLGGLQGGFFVQTSSSVTGALAYSIALPASPIPTVCNSGSAAIIGTITDQSVALTATAGTQTFTLTGTLSPDNQSMGGTYNSTAGTASDGGACGSAETGLQWSATLVPPLTGSIQGNFQSAGGAAGLSEQDFLVSGALNQDNNVGAAASATVTGNLNFLNPTTNLSDYPCFASATVQGQISGNTVTLQIVAADGTPIGLIGETVATVGSTVVTTGLNPVTFTSTNGGYVVSGGGPSYLVSTAGGATPCPGQLNDTNAAGDFGNICLTLNGTTGCPQPFKLTPSGLVFPIQPAGSPSTIQTVTLTNTSGATLTGLKLSFGNADANVFTETDACGPGGTAAGVESFSLEYGQSCAIAVTFTPLACSNQCGTPLTATLTVRLSNELILILAITGEESVAAVSTRGLDFVAESASQMDVPQLLSLNLSLPLLQAANASPHSFQDAEHHAEIE